MIVNNRLVSCLFVSTSANYNHDNCASFKSAKMPSVEDVGAINEEVAAQPRENGGGKWRRHEIIWR